MKKDGIQTRNRKLAAKAKKKRMHDFFKPSLDPRFSAYTGMHAGGAGSYLPMSQYYAGQMGQMSSFMSNSMGPMSAMGSPMSHLTGLASLPTDHLTTADVQHQQHQQLQQQQQQQHHQQQSFTNGASEETNPANIPTSLVGASA